MRNQVKSFEYFLFPTKIRKESEYGSIDIRVRNNGSGGKKIGPNDSIRENKKFGDF